MSGDERKLVDTAGEYLYAVKDGVEVTDPQWHSCRLVMTTSRFVLSTETGTQTIPYANIELVPDDDVSEGIDSAGVTPLGIGDNVILFDASGVSDFEREYCRAALHDEVILANHPAVVGGVIQDDAQWRKARFRLNDGTVRLAFAGGDATSFATDDVGTIETVNRTVRGEERTVLEVEHTDESGRSVETHFSGMAHHRTALAWLFEAVAKRRESEYELNETENQVLMALYSGVSPFEMADFVGLDVEEVETVYQNLLDAGAVDEVRTRTEVALNAQGRNIASEAMSEQ